MDHPNDGALSPTDYAAAVAALGLSNGRIAGELHCHRNLPHAWETGRLSPPPVVMAWLKDLLAHHMRRPQPPPPQQWRTRSAA